MIPKVFFMNQDPTNIQIVCLGDGINIIKV